ncbi:indole-3-glycerol phosphate synthase TrpC [Actinomyces mediterranea]|uniref:indole-3-glycerol phosphate synthase TrpC n=1 Tax=Actinomyces mediterranea TaxID=1871028 RepID=UPI0009708CFB|nr:indole-3-glycerol phosphate synthase TrpC [Actinomyces mediterranea]
MSVLDDIIAGVLEDVRARECDIPLADMKMMALAAPDSRDFIAAMKSRQGAVSIIPEIKRAAPMRGRLAQIDDPAGLASIYEAGGASAISVFTERRYFGGSLADLDAVRTAVEVPLLQKDFIVTPYQIHEARAHGADVVLLIVAALEQPALVSLLERVHSLGMDALVEVHSRYEALLALEAGAHMIGVNAWNLKTMELNRDTVDQVIDIIPDDVVAVAESGVRTAHDVFEYAKAGADAVVSGEALVTSTSPADCLADMVAAGSHPALLTDRRARVRQAHHDH